MQWAAARPAAWRPHFQGIATWPTPSIAPRSHRSGALANCRRVAGSPPSSCSKQQPTAPSVRCGSRARIRRNRCPICASCAAPSSAPSSSSCRKRLQPKRRRSPICCCPRRHGARRKAPSRTPSGAEPDFESAEELWNEHRATTIGRDLDIGGLSYAILDRDGPQQWPYRAGARTGMARLYENGVFATPDGRARFVPTPYAAVADPIDARFPLRLTTGRLRDQWHGMSRTGRTSALAGHVSQPRLALNVDDMALAGLRAGDWAFVASRRGRIAVPVEPSRALRRGHAYMPMHWGSHWLFGPSGEGGVNELTIAALDPHSRQPELKHAAVRVEPARFAWHGWWIAAAGNDENAALARVREAARGLGYAIVGFAAGPAPGVVLHAAADIAPSAARLAALDALFGVAAGGCGVLRYDDARSS